MWFWIIVVMLIALVVSLFVQAMLRGRDTGVSAAEFDVRVYRDQLDGVERDLERGVVSPEEAKRIKVEVSRRLLDADKAVQAAFEVKAAPHGVTYAALATCVVVLLGSVGVYQDIGQPGYSDLPLRERLSNAKTMRDKRPSQSVLEAESPRMVLLQKLRNTMEERPDDLQGQVYLVNEEVLFGSFSAAYQAQKRVIEIKGDQAEETDFSALSDLKTLNDAEQESNDFQTLSLLLKMALEYRNSVLAYNTKAKLMGLDGAEVVAKDFSDLAYLMFLAAGGHVSPEAESIVLQALEHDKNDGWGRYFYGLIDYQNSRPDKAFYIWRQLIEDSPPTAPWVGPIRSSIEEAAYYAGSKYTLPAAAASNAPALAGPDAGAVAAASDMTAEERQDMIGNMVSQLSERLATEGGSAKEWAQLIGALGVLGEADRAAAIWNEAQSVFASDTAALEMINAAAKRAGVAP